MLQWTATQGVRFDWESSFKDSPFEIRHTAWIIGHAKHLRYIAKPIKALRWRRRRESGKVLNEWLVKARADAGITTWPNNALRHSFVSYACAMTEDYPKVSAWIGHSGGTALLEARYRHAVPKDAGKTWFDVLPTDPPTAKKSVTGKSRLNVV